MNQNDQCDNCAVVNGEVTNTSYCREVLELLRKVLNPLTIGVHVDNTAQNTVGTQGKDERWSLHNGNAPGVYQANCYTNKNTYQASNRKWSSISEHAANYYSNKTQVGTNRNVNLTNEQGEGHTNSDQCVDNGRVKAGSNCCRCQECGIHCTNNNKESNQECEAAQSPSLEKALYKIHTSPPTIQMQRT